MARAFRLPDLGEGLTEGEVAHWLVSEGQEIAEDDPLVEIQTDKATVEIPSPYAGTVLRILVAEGELAPVGAELVLIGEPGEVTEESEGQSPSARSGGQSPSARSGGQSPSGRSGGQSPSGRSGGQSPSGTVPSREAGARSAGSGRVQATPLVRKIAQELGVDLAAVPGTGPGGRITEDDVRAAAGAAGATSGEGRREPLRGVRRVIAEHMARAHREVPAVTWVEECDFTDVALERLVATVLRACADALPEFPELNARLEGDEIVYLDRYDLGVAVQTEQGLVVPVVRGVDSMSLDEVHAEVSRLANAARDGSLRPEELRGSTFTVTSAGKLAGLFQTPIVNHPEVAILSVGRIAPRPVVRDSEIVVRQMGTVAVTFDHRVVDGARAAAFGLAVISRLEGNTLSRH